MLAGEEYGVDILRVQGIQGLQPLTAIPNTPPYMLGVMNLRGAIVPVIDLRVRFELAQVEQTKTTVVVVVHVESDDVHRTVGMVVDAVSEVYSIADSNCQPTPSLGAVVDLDFIRGLATVESKMIILLEVDALINDGLLDRPILESVHEAPGI
ncbi:MAG: chemotaxis protein CheW [Gammaproteobacteria bacterium]|nr:chemotaxis protein CheW [Gammaproteobacteria bacterium]